MPISDAFNNQDVYAKMAALTVFMKRLTVGRANTNVKYNCH